VTLCLDRDELVSLTGRKQPKRMCRWLADNGWKFVVGADGLPKVDREYYRQRLATPEPEKRRRPRLERLAHGPL
jgi:hypothetical protein